MTVSSNHYLPELMGPELHMKRILAAEELYHAGDYAEAEKVYTDTMNAMESAKTVDAFLTAKATLALLLIFLHRGDVPAAADLWRTKREASIRGLGIYLLDEGLQLSEGDIALYRLVTAFLFSLGDEDPEKAADKVEYLMSLILAYAVENDEQLFAGALSNWNHYLTNIYEDAEIPAHRTRLLEEGAKLLEGGIPDYPISFPLPERLNET